MTTKVTDDEDRVRHCRDCARWPGYNGAPWQSGGTCPVRPKVALPTDGSGPECGLFAEREETCCGNCASWEPVGGTLVAGKRLGTCRRTIDGGGQDESLRPSDWDRCTAWVLRTQHTR